MKGATRWFECDTVCGTLESYEAHAPASGLLRLQLRDEGGSMLEVLADAASALEQLAAVFGSPEAALGQWIELALDQFGFARLRSTRSRVHEHPHPSETLSRRLPWAK
jgi:hypothetical protein